jgi:hypothetical protein
MIEYDGVQITYVKTNAFNIDFFISNSKKFVIDGNNIKIFGIGGYSAI